MTDGQQQQQPLESLLLLLQRDTTHDPLGETCLATSVISAAMFRYGFRNLVRLVL